MSIITLNPSSAGRFPLTDKQGKALLVAAAAAAAVW